MATQFVYDDPATSDPRESKHFSSLKHEEGDVMIQSLEDLKTVFVNDIFGDAVSAIAGRHCDNDDSGKDKVCATKKHKKCILAYWSCLCGYCEALATHKDETRRYNLYPIPWTALKRMIDNELVSPLYGGEWKTHVVLEKKKGCKKSPPKAQEKGNDNESSQGGQENHYDHRSIIHGLANWVWSRVVSKTNIKDELHANSVYTVLRGEVDGKSVDCFGAAMTTVIAARECICDEGERSSSSVLTLSEDHAYESHNDDSGVWHTCEIAIPGNTKAQRAKRGQDTNKTFAEAKVSGSTDSTTATSTRSSWLYMGEKPVICDSIPMMLAAAVGNINCLIQKNGRKLELYSQQLLLLKRELLWLLKDNQDTTTGKAQSYSLSHFPFAICELASTEEHCTSKRGDAMVSIPELTTIERVSAIEQLYFEAIQCSKTHYNDKQVYPYLYMAFFHKDAGQDRDHEYRLPLAVEWFTEATRVATTSYAYEARDTGGELVKKLNQAADTIRIEILSAASSSSPQQQIPREWKDAKHAETIARDLIHFYDLLLVWEERAKDRFLRANALSPTNLQKTFALLDAPVRRLAFEHITGSSAVLQSNRLKGTLGAALKATKISINDLHLELIMETSRRARKRKER